MSGCCVDKECTRATCMDLPAGQTCAGCKHFRRCVMLFGCEPERRTCDWFPRRFLPIVETATR